MINIRNSSNKRFKLISLFGLLFFPAYALADGGGPILLLISIFAFTIGQVWILSVETIYFSTVFKGIKFGYSFVSVFLMNLVSTVIGGILFPVLISLITLPFALFSSSSPKLFGIATALGTWITGDSTPYPKLAIGMTVFWFICAYFITVYVEYRVLSKRLEKIEYEVEKRKLKTHCFILNLISYAGLAVLFFILE